MDQHLLEAQLQELPLYFYDFVDPKQLDFSDRVRWICEHECPMYEKTWACPPAVGSVSACQQRCKGYDRCLMIATMMRQQGVEPYILSTEACALCERCAYLDGQPCRQPEKMHPCVESHGINILGLIEEKGLAFQYGENVVTWFSLLLFSE